ncbi:hypothetical protein FRB90_007538 [Tulasnella sp. 427]|nr:hypothetical protein FRB90_007538 [Tulasnella sp. 427]
MRFSIVAVLLAASFASAFNIFRRQTTARACAKTCAASANPSPCNATDAACLCLNQNYVMAVDTCAQASCSQSDLQAAEAAGIAYCQAAGVDFTGQGPFPTCAQTCVARTYAGACAATDGQDLQSAITVGEAFCRANGVDISSIAGA